MRRSGFSLVLLLQLARLTAEQQTNDPAVLARTIIDRLAANDFAAVIATFDQKMREALPEEKLRLTWNAVITQMGAFKGQEAPRMQGKGDFRIVVVTGEFERGRA